MAFVAVLAASACTSASSSQDDLSRLRATAIASALRSACDQVRIATDQISWVALTPGWGATPTAHYVADVLQDVALALKQDGSLLEAAGATSDANLVKTTSSRSQTFSNDVAKLSLPPPSFKSDYIALRGTLIAMTALRAPIGGPCGGILGPALPSVPRSGHPQSAAHA